ncbi:MAG: NAD(P)-binding domain-containing protein, partial [Alphaproteobacteria bacterium]|nr:NAD(P)-binding domain-containing protein [Alphaproteobacteria bacterium]
MIGCGKMGGALLDHWMTGDEDFTIVDPGLEQAPDGARLLADRDALEGERFDVVVVAIKPQMIDDLMPPYRDHLAPGGYVLSIAAGTSAARIA